MSQKFTSILVGGILAFSTRLFVASAPAGQINATPLPIASGPGLGLANIASNVTVVPNNDDSPGSLPDNNMVVTLKRFDSNGYIDIVFTVTPSAGVTEYQVIQGVDNNTNVNWNAYTLLLGFGTGVGFTQASGIGDGLDFDTGPPGGNTTPPTSATMPNVDRPNEDSLVFSGGTQGSGVQQYQFRIDVSDLLSRNGTFTLRQQPVLLLGDYNRNGIVDAADYVVWRKTDGTQTGYDTWRSHFGETSGIGSGASANATVPEPTTLVLLMFAATGWCLRRGRVA